MEERVISGSIPNYYDLQFFLHIVDGFNYCEFDDMLRSSKVNIRKWVEARLLSNNEAIALSIPQELKELVDLESVSHWDLENLSGWHSEGWIKNDVVCLSVVYNDIIRLTDDGRRFRDKDEVIIRKIDEFEGLLFILGAITESGSCCYIDLLDDFERFFEKYVEDWPFGDTHHDESLPPRLENLERRDLIRTSGDLFLPTDAGRGYYSRCRQAALLDSSLALITEMNDVFRRRQLAKLLPKMHHKKFEELIKKLLRKMGYRNVQVTRQTRDGGIDVVADLEAGITHVRHVIQAKRQETPVGIGVVDRLRGSLHRGGAGLQPVGTIITTSNFTKGARDAAVEKGVAPITLIDGEALLDLLVKYGFTVKKGK
ncbi:MAG: restriction endonuclease [Anaerolineae bacterium]|nr:restriction endonuclease [Anaerolineae bacterium]